MEKAEESKKTAGILNMFSKQQLIMIGAVLGVSVLLLIVGIFCGVNKIHSDAAEAAAAATEKKMAEVWISTVFSTNITASSTNLISCTIR